MSIVAKTNSNSGSESYLHRYAKQVLVQWLREAAQRSDKNGYATLWGCSWQVTRNAPTWGVHEEWSVLAADNVIKHPASPWDEIDWAKTIPGLKPRVEGEDGYSHHSTYPHPPRAEFLRIWKVNPAAILDVAVQGLSHIAYAFEVVHKSPVSEEKRQLLKDLGIQLVEINALWILCQIGCPDKLVTAQEMQLYVPRVVGKDAGFYGIASAVDFECIFTSWVANRKSSSHLIFDPYARAWGDHEVDEGEGATLFECLARTKYARLGGDFDFLERVMGQCLTRGASYGGNKDAGTDWGIYYCSAFKLDEPIQQGIMGDEPDFLTVDEFAKNNEAVAALLDGWEMCWGVTDGSASTAFGSTDILRVIAEYFDSEAFDTLLKEGEKEPRYVKGYASRKDWLLYLNIAQRIKTHPNDRTYMYQSDYEEVDSWVDDFVEESLAGHS